MPIETIAEGDIVFSVDHEAIVSVPVVRVARTPVPSWHRMVRATLAGGALVEMSPGHPTADGRTFGDLVAGATLGESELLDVHHVVYDGAFTYDILPASSTGTYYAAGILVGSTLAHDGGCGDFREQSRSESYVPGP